MPLPQIIQRAVLAIRDVIQAGGRVLRSSRSFWARYGFPPIEQRTEAIQTAREIQRVSNEIEAGSIRGTLSQALADAGLPTTDLSGGLTGGTESTIYGRAEYTASGGGTVYRSFKLSLPWYSSIDQLESAIEDMISDIGDAYGLEGGTAVSGSIVVY